MLPLKLAFIDIETTGTRSRYDRVLEIGILRVENNQITKTFQALLNPQTRIPPEITRMTGISPLDIKNSPTFRQIKDDILEIIDGCIFVAHNVRFDYGFIKNEFMRLNHTFTHRHFCTVRLSRLLYPNHQHHNLSALIERFNFPYEKRHRAFDDAKILYHFYQKIQQDFTPEILEKAINQALKQPTLPLHLKTDLNTIPEHPGVYIFYASDGAPLYVGKSINLKERIKSHFSADIHSPLEMRISQQIETIETIPTAGELGALLLESQLIKKLLPLYNRKSRLKRELIALKSRQNPQGYQETYLEPYNIAHNKLTNILSLFKSHKQAKDYLTKIAKEHKLCEKLLGLEKTKTACFSYRLGNCKGACVGKESPLHYNLRFLTAFAPEKIKPWPFPATILIKETDIQQKSDYLLIDQWCYFGTIKEDSETNYKKDTTKTPAFDIDIYHILTQFFKNPRNHNKIKLLTTPHKAQLNLI